MNLPCLSTKTLHTIARDGEGCQVRANIGCGSLLGFAADLCRRAYRARARRRWRALGRRRALDFRAARTRARRAFTCLILTGTAINDDGLGFRDAALEDILTEIRHRRALRLEHILTQIRHLRARRNCALKDILAEVGFTARRAGDTSGRTTATRILVATTRAPCRANKSFSAVCGSHKSSTHCCS
jgi:hypothetical protein